MRAELQKRALPEPAGSAVTEVGAPDPFGLTEELAPVHSQEALLEMAELLEMVHYWRTRCEEVESDRDTRIARWRKAQKK